VDKKVEKRIYDLRDKIDAVDRKMVDFLNERAGYARELGDIKIQVGLPIYMPKREEEVIYNVKTHNKGPLSNDAIQRLYERIIDESRRLEREHSQKKKANDKKTH
jgi:chorismate mutase